MPSTKYYSHFLKLLGRSTDLMNDDPVREEIFSVESLEQYALHLANTLKVNKKPGHGRSLLTTLRKDGADLQLAYLTLSDAIRKKQTISPAAEWFVDNFHIIDDQLREIKLALPTNYYFELPKLSSGQLKGYPRVYAIALAIIAHTDSRLDIETIYRFIKSFQKVAPLQIGEHWALLVTLRIALIGHLNPLSKRIVNARRKREQADILADKVLEYAAQKDTRSEDLIYMLSQEIGPRENLDRAFIVQMIHRLRDQDPDIWPAFDWLENELKVHYETSTHEVIQLEHHRQASAKVFGLLGFSLLL